MRLVVGKTYRHQNPKSASRFVIETQWNENLFEGRAVCPDGTTVGYAYMFNSVGEALGWRGNRNGASLGWRITEANPELEYRTIVHGHVDSKWYRLTSASGTAVLPHAQYLVRESGKDDTVRLVSSTEFRSLVSKA